MGNLSQFSGVISGRTGTHFPSGKYDRESKLMKSNKALLCMAICFSSFSAKANCLDDVTRFAIGICGEIERTGKRTVVNADGNLDVGISNIVRRLVGGGTGSASGAVLTDAYENVLREQLGPELFDVRKCRQTMVPVGIEQACPKPAPPKQSRATRICFGEGGGHNCGASSNANLDCNTYYSFGAGGQMDNNLKKAYCSTNINGQSIQEPAKVEVYQNNGGGKCGWTGFIVTCNP
jgi:hypothetical protein